MATVLEFDMTIAEFIELGPRAADALMEENTGDIEDTVAVIRERFKEAGIE